MQSSQWEEQATLLGLGYFTGERFRAAFYSELLQLLSHLGIK